MIAWELGYPPSEFLVYIQFNSANGHTGCLVTTSLKHLPSLLFFNNSPCYWSLENIPAALVYLQRLYSKSTFIAPVEQAKKRFGWHNPSIGHSFGSFLSNALLATSPSLSDGAILTGLGYSAGGASFEAWSARIAAQLSPGKWPGRDLHYVTWIDSFANAATFFFGDSYSKKVLAYTEYVKQPLAVIELLTLQTLPLAAHNFFGPVMVCLSSPFHGENT